MLSVEVTAGHYSPTPLDLQVDIPLEQGVVGIMGPSGCGKTTLLKLLAGLETRYQGKVLLSNRTLWSTAEQIALKAHHRNIGLVFQDARLFPHLTVLGNLQFAVKRAQNPRFDLAQVIHWFGLKNLLEATPSALSGGQRQRVAVARAVLHSPQLLLLDEPFVSLDSVAREELLGCLRLMYRQTRLPMLFVSHDVDDIRRLCEYLLVLEEGKIVISGETVHVLNQLHTGLRLAQPIASTLCCSESLQMTELPLTRLRLGGQWVLSSHSLKDWQSEMPRAVVRADDVSVSLNAVSDCSIANCLSAIVSEINPINEHNVLLSLECEGQLLYSQITCYSQQRLKLAVGQPVYALFKAAAVQLV